MVFKHHADLAFYQKNTLTDETPDYIQALDLNRDPEACPRELIEEVSATVDEFVGNAPQFDDITMLAVTYKPNQK